VLKAMKRTYNRERYLERVAMIRDLVPDCALTTDVIVGFPGEAEEDFAQTLSIVEQVGYDSAFTFVFSPRRETAAAEYRDQVPHAVKRERMGRLVEAVQRRAAERAERFVGRTMGVLVEGPSRSDETTLRGRIRHNKMVHFAPVPGESAGPGDLVDVEIASATSMTLVGAERALVLGKKSGLDSIRLKAEQLGLELPVDRHAELLAEVKRLGAKRRRLVSDDEFRDLVAETAPSRID